MNKKLTSMLSLALCLIRVVSVFASCTEKEPEIIPATSPVISAQCLRVPVQDGHMAAVSVKFANKPSKEDILKAWQKNGTIAQELSLPSAPTPFLRYMEEDNRPQSLSYIRPRNAA